MIIEKIVKFLNEVRGKVFEEKARLKALKNTRKQNRKETNFLTLNFSLPNGKPNGNSTINLTQIPIKEKSSQKKSSAKFF